MLILGLGLGMVMQVLVLVGPERDALRHARRRDVRLDAVPLDRRLARHRDARRDLPARLAAEVATGDGQITAFTDSLHVVFLVAAAIMVVAFALELADPREAAAQDGRATVVGDAIGGPVDTDSVRELTRALSRAAGRERTLAFMAARRRARRRRPLPRRLAGR